ncbi:MAG: GTP 3',8-cyclase MoaA [Cyclobacteriaceae bacterium]|nr:GTP 3',8-cyclase MoaA [Cyclobacteriaceae bacterium]
MTTPLTDSFGRPLEYLRLAVTDRCNLRCFYCMPAEGIEYVPKQDLLSYEEMLRLTRIFVQLGVNKIRLTGGEPFIRKNFYGFLKRLTKIDGLDKIAITTNGSVANKHIPFLKEIGITSINLSLDTLNKEKFNQITRRDFFNQAMNTYQAVLNAGIKLSVNMVVMEGKNIEDIIPMAMLTKTDNVTIRYIEEMPFNGKGTRNTIGFNHAKILELLTSDLPDLSPISFAPGTTAQEYSIEGHKGKVGIIAAHTRTFCNSCNRIRVTATGQMKNCLYDQGMLNLKRMLTDGSSDQMICEAIKAGYDKKFKNGLEAEANQANPISESMSSIGG